MASQEKGKSDTEVSDSMTVIENPRERTLTERGREWRLSQLMGKFRSSVTRWQKQVSSITILLSDSDDCNAIRGERQNLDQYFQELSLLFDEICQLDVETTLSNKFDTIAEEHKNFMLRISDAVRSLESDNFSVHSSKLSSGSRASQMSRISVAAKAASLKAKLKYVDVESKTRAELQKIEILKELEMANAKLQAFKSVEFQSLNASEIGDPPDTHVDKNTLVKDYIMSQSKFQMPVRDPALDPSPTPSLDMQIKTEPTSVPLNHPHPVSDHLEPNTNSANLIPSPHAPLEQGIGLRDRRLDPAAQVFLPSRSTEIKPKSVPDAEATTLQQGLLNLTKSLADQVSLNRLPPPEPNKFFGDPIQYPAWKMAFKTLVEQRNLPDGEKIHYLKKYLGGSVLQVVENYFLLSNEDAYDEAKNLLDERFGDPFIIASAFRDRLDAWPKISARDAQGLLRFSDFLKQCLAATSQYSSLEILNDCRENRKMLSKLPEWLASRWNRVVGKSKEEKRVFPSFKVFVDFVGKEAKIANDPVTSVQSLRGAGVADENKSNKDLQRQHSKFDKRPGGRSFLSGVEENTSVSVENSSCYFCKRPHDLDDCKAFLGKSLAERKAFVGDKKLCFACLGSGHISRDCRHRKKCRFCRKFHPSSLHGDLKTQIQTVKDNRSSGSVKDETSSNHATHLSLTGSAFLSSTNTVSKCSMVLPVYVSHCDDPSNERLVYALLDTQSDATFILEDTCKALGRSGVSVKLALSTMHAENKIVESQRVKGLLVRGFNSDLKIPLPATYTRDIMPADRAHIPTPNVVNAWPYLHPVAEHLVPLQECEIGLLIGYNCPRALVPREVVAPKGDGPYGQRTDLGWGVVGIVDTCVSEIDSVGLSHRIVSCEIPSNIRSDDYASPSSVSFSLRTSVKEVITADVLKLLEQDFQDRREYGRSLSHQDHRFLELLGQGTSFKEGHYEMPLPFVEEDPVLPDNRLTAFKRLNQLRRRLERDDTFRKHYLEFMKELVDSGHAEKVQEAELARETNKVWYIPHHGVYHPKKPDKIRVVFDCSASYQDVCLNSYLLQGPDLINSLLGVICRFRKEPIAIMCDVEKMFYQFRVTAEHRDYLRFLWWENGDFTKDPVDYRMSVHLFGAKSSPGCANFGFKKMANDHEKEFGAEVADFIRRDFYVDDGLKSVATASKAVELVGGAKVMCSKAGLRLHKFVCNSKEVLEHLPSEDLAKDLKDIDLSHESLPIERALGILWCIESDTFQFRLTLSDNPLTRRGIMSTISSIYDPLGLISPVVLIGKRILQQVCADRADWDDPVPDSLRVRWEKWHDSLFCLETLKVPRCVKPEDLDEVKLVEMHHFSDASTVGYGQCSYLRIMDKAERVHCSLLYGKSRVAPLKPMTIPRLELTAALLSVRNSSMLDLEFEIPNVIHFYWTDSQVVLGYVSNEARRFHVFVANRVQEIRNQTCIDQWNYVPTDENPADIASRGIFANEFVRHPMWFNGPEFLWKLSLPIKEMKNVQLNSSDPEVKRIECFAVETSESSTCSMLDRLLYFSDWNRARKAIALCLRFKSKLRSRSMKKPKLPLKKEVALAQYIPICVEEMRLAEIEIFKLVQEKHFHSETVGLQTQGIVGFPSDRKNTKARRKLLKKSSSLCRLDPFVDSSGVLRVGGRVQHSDLSEVLKYPVLLPKVSPITNLVVAHFHDKIHHQGRGMTINAIRTSGVWILGCSSVVSGFISKCVVCRRNRSNVQGQKMSDLPRDRLEQVPPFTYCAVDLFGPWYIREGRKELKRYGVLFTCLSCRAVHVETANTLETDSFINSLRRFIAVRGPMRQLRCDRGTNFVGAERELREAFQEMDDRRVREFLLQESCDYFPFKMNVPSASHMGGVWERQIRSVRSVLNSLLVKHGSQLNDESLRTFMHEAAAVVNCRPLSVDNLNDPVSVTPLTPNHLVTMKSSIVLPPPGNFQRPDLYCRKQWRRTQYLVNEFWSRWRSEFLQTLQVRKKWESPKRNMCVGDVVLLKEDNASRSQWHLGRVKDVFVDDDGLVRKVGVEISTCTLNAQGKRSRPLTYLERPIHKLILLLETEELPNEEPKGN